MRSDLLVLNEKKIEVIQFSSRLKSDVDRLDGLRISESIVIPFSSLRNSGVIFDESFSISEQVSVIERAAYFALH